MTYVVQTNKLTKTIGEKNLVTNVSMHVKKGEIYGFLGPNGARCLVQDALNKINTFNRIVFV